MSSIEHLLGLKIHGDIHVPNGEGGWIEILPGGVHVGEEPPEEDERFLWLDPSEPPPEGGGGTGGALSVADGGRADTVYGGGVVVDAGDAGGA